ncbi:MAG: hypothetical protein AUJ96_20695 [Armatimonadetes bacterium CG2_30_66_41]|nr:Gfo/Idh/MocA family oxidoreductase [Armatimonadota bacterium]OIO98705.1 MAG: hypothetical protein AUJ96_20695 [Armatimonadetes bacterium CG2_30_66_41]PIU89889.1 MAG: oxidoreductase [Armatimonadetes bacterium CG06_land_8_20_14_3_00_66_21]NCP28993.1 Gfo/Idh/MocA family oxidoreductase [Armatimonadota bacterium]NCQ30042.1 Gfo/Idh/MocA family oxidoreductase [Armatimonadota bacterium]
MTPTTDSTPACESTDDHGASRRRFLRSAAAAVAVPPLVRSRALGAAAETPANDRINLGFIGIGGRGSGHVDYFMRQGQAQVVAVCDPYQSKREQAKKAVEGYYAAAAGKGEYKGCADYADFRELVARDDIDAVVIASPEYWHALHSLGALKAGKDVYCEKALTLTVAEGLAVCDTVRRHGRVFQIGTQQRSDGRFRVACELARNGYLGKVHTVEVGVPGGQALPNAPPKEPPPDIDYEMWLGPAPWTPYNDLKCSFNWYFIYDYCVGWIQSWGVHHVDIAQWGAPSLSTQPLEVEGSATFPTDGLANTSLTWRVSYTAADGVRLSFTDNAQHPQGCKFLGDKGWVHVDRGSLSAEPASLLQVALKPADEHLHESNNHALNFLDCIRTRRDPVAPVEGGFTATALTLIGDIATRLGRKLRWDWQTRQFVDDEAANRMLSRPMRSPWCV